MSQMKLMEREVNESILQCDKDKNEYQQDVHLLNQKFEDVEDTLKSQNKILVQVVKKVEDKNDFSKKRESIFTKRKTRGASRNKR